MADLALIKKLRESTSCGIADCNRALKEVNDDFNKAVDWLRKKGLSSAVKKSGRVTSEGAVAVAIKGSEASIIEVNSETDFVARNQKFQNFVQDIAGASIGFGSDIDKLRLSKYPSLDITIEEEAKNQIGVIGENINIRRIDNISVNQGVVSSYIHNAIIPNLGKIAVLVAIESSANQEKLQEFGKQIAMHIAAAKPDSLTVDSVDDEKLKREISILREQAKNSGKPDNIIEKMMDGRIRKYYEEVVLLEQFFVMDDKIKIKDIVKNYSKEVGSEVQITDFKLFILGDGIEKKENDFAAEVASMSQ